MSLLQTNVSVNNTQQTTEFYRRRHSGVSFAFGRCDVFGFGNILTEAAPVLSNERIPCPFTCMVHFQHDDRGDIGAFGPELRRVGGFTPLTS